MNIRNPGDVAAYIKLRRSQLKLSQTVLAGKAGVSRSWLAEVESGKTTVEVGKLLKLAKVLEVAVSVAEKKQEGRSLIDEIVNEHRKSR